MTFNIFKPFEWHMCTHFYLKCYKNALKPFKYLIGTPYGNELVNLVFKSKFSGGFRGTRRLRGYSLPPYNHKEYKILIVNTINILILALSVLYFRLYGTSQLVKLCTTRLDIQELHHTQNITLCSLWCHFVNIHKCNTYQKKQSM